MRRTVLAALLTAGLAAGFVPAAAAAQRPLVTDGPRPVPNVRLRPPAFDAGTSWSAPTRPDAGFDARDYRDVVPPEDGRDASDDAFGSLEPGDTLPARFLRPEYRIDDHAARGLAMPPRGSRWVRGDRDDVLLVDGGGRVRDVVPGAAFDRFVERRGYDVETGFHPEDRDRAYPERLARGGSRDLAYDRNYPFEYPYGGQGAAPSVEAPVGPYGGYIVTETIVTTTTPDTVRRARPGEVVGPDGYLLPPRRRR